MQTYPSRYTVIESLVWVNTHTGQRASTFGAIPWTDPADRPSWTLQAVGYTVRDNRLGTVGIGRKPWDTREQAQQWVNGQNGI